MDTLVKKESASLWCDDSIEDLHEKYVNPWCNDEDKAEAKCDKCKDKRETYNTPKRYMITSTSGSGNRRRLKRQLLL